ncbi:hypothetical protein CK203_075750 [Vitis vinifera]|uniref:Uncharacterized protein n=1 Tax=Vitis vinifera TaxID=29760 RepID=A0A438F716_VITVI|nr:hypothetical protein CK203_075750 [Vitis vinifera]
MCTDSRFPGCYGLGLNWWQSSYGGPRALHFLRMLRFALSTSLSPPNQQLQNDAVFYSHPKTHGADRSLSGYSRIESVLFNGERGC